VEEKAEPRKTPKPGRKIQKTQKDPEAPVDPGACGGNSKTPGGIPASSKGKLSILLRREGFTASSSTVGRILRYLKTRSLLKEERNRGGFLPQKAHGGIKDPMPRESPISNSPPEISSCGGPIPPSMLKPWNLPRVFLEELRKVPLSRSNQGVLEGVHATGSLRVLAGIRHQALRPSSKVSHIPG
jgi:hypothetical protein